MVRHPAVALVGAVVFALVAVMLIHGSVAARNQLAAADDPVEISDQALDRTFNRDVAEREIRAALASGDIDLAQSFVALAADRGVAIDPALADKVQAASAKHASAANTAGRFVHGLWTGEPTDLASLAGTAFGDLFVFGDIRDAAREGTRYLTGQHYDPWILGLAGVGIAHHGCDLRHGRRDRAGADRPVHGQGGASYRPAQPGSWRCARRAKW